MWGFTEKDSIEQRQEVTATKRMIGFFLGLTLFMLAIFRFIPKDIFTTATWIDGRGLGLLYSGGATAFSEGSFWDISNMTVPVSEEAFWVAILITVFQLTFGYLSGVSGSYVYGKNADSMIYFFILLAKGECQSSKVNWKKIGFVGTFLIIALFDTYTDWQFSSKYGTDPRIVWEALIYSFIVYNLASEFAFIMGLQLAIGNAPEAIGGFFRTAWSIVTSLWDGGGQAKQQQKKPSSGQQPQSQQQGGGKKQQQGGQPKQGGQQHNPQQQPQRQHQPMRPVSHEQNGGNRANLPEYRMEPLDLDNL